MSFLSILRTIGLGAAKGLEVAAGITQVAAPVAAIVLGPAAAAVINRITAGVIGAETLIAGAKSGIAKHQTVAQIVASELPQLDAIIQELGVGAVLDQGALNEAINATVAQMNAVTKLIATAKHGQPAPVTMSLGAGAPKQILAGI